LSASIAYISHKLHAVLLLFLSPSAQSRRQENIQNYGCNGNLLSDHGIVERSRISSLERHGKSLEKECCLPGVFCDGGETPVILLCELIGHLMTCTSYLYGKWVEDVCASQFGVFVYLVLRCLVDRCTWFCCCAANVLYYTRTRGWVWRLPRTDLC